MPTFEQQEQKKKKREQLLEMLQKGYTPDFIKFASYATGGEVSDVETELNTLNSIGFGGEPENQVEVGGRKFQVKTLADQKAFEDLSGKEEESKALTSTALDDFSVKLSQLDNAITDEKGLKSAVGTFTGGRLPTPISGAKQRFLGTVDQIVSTEALDSLIEAKGKGATFGALSEGEMRILKSAATKFGTWEVRDKDGAITGYNVREEDFLKELKTLKFLTEKAKGKVEATQQPTQPIEQAQPVQQQVRIGGEVRTMEEARVWANDNQDDPRAVNFLQDLENDSFGAKKEEVVGSTSGLPQENGLTSGLQQIRDEEPEIDSIFGDIGEGFESIQQRAGERADKVGKTLKSDSDIFSKARTIFAQGAGLGADIIGEGVVTAGKAALSQENEDKIKEVFTGAVGRVMQMESVQGMMAYYERIKTEKPELAQEIENGLNVLDLATSFTGAGIGIKQSGKLLSKEALRAGKLTGKAAKGVAKGGEVASKFGISQATGLAPDTIKQVLETPGAFTAKEMANISRESIFGKVNEAIGSKIDEFSELGRAYDPIRNSGDFVSIDKTFLDDSLKKHGFDIVDGKIKATTKSSTRETSDINAIQSFYDNWSGKDVLEADEFLNMRADLAGLAKFGQISGKTKASQTIGKGIRADLNTKYRGQLEGLSDLDSQFSEQIGGLNDLKKIIFNRDGSVKDNAISTISNLTGKGKEQKLAKIREIMPDIDEQVNMLKAVEDITLTGGQKVGSYGRSIVGFGGGGIVGGFPGAIAGMILTSPKVAVSLLRKYAQARNIASPIVEGIVDKMKSGTKLLEKEVKVLNNAVEEASKKIEDRIKKIRPGLTIQSTVELQKKQDELINLLRNAKTDKLKKQYTNALREIDKKIAKEPR